MHSMGSGTEDGRLSGAKVERHPFRIRKSPRIRLRSCASFANCYGRPPTVADIIDYVLMGLVKASTITSYLYILDNAFR